MLTFSNVRQTLMTFKRQGGVEQHLRRHRDERIYIYAEKLQELGVLKNKAASWKDCFFEEAHGGNGS